MLFFRYPRKNMETKKIDPLCCLECEGALLPERVIRLQNGTCVLRYVCIGCRSRSYAMKVGSAVHMYPSINILESVTSSLALSL